MVSPGRTPTGTVGTVSTGCGRLCGPTWWRIASGGPTLQRHVDVVPWRQPFGEDEYLWRVGVGQVLLDNTQNAWDGMEAIIDACKGHPSVVVSITPTRAGSMTAETLIMRWSGGMCSAILALVRREVRKERMGREVWNSYR
jgi:hypothetical protein